MHGNGGKPKPAMQCRFTLQDASYDNVAYLSRVTAISPKMRAISFWTS